MQRASVQSIPFESLGFSLNNDPAGKMARPHRHNEIEMTVLEKGWIEYLFGASRVVVPAGALCVRWAAIPHQSIDFEDRGTHYSLKIPLAWFLQWQLPVPFVNALLSGAMLLDREAEHGCADFAMFGRWFAALREGTPEQRRIVLLEAEARLLRMALRVSANDAPDHGVMTRARLGKVEHMAVFVAANYTRPVRIDDIAGAVRLHPNSAMRLFRKACGLTLLEYLTLHRVWHAQRLLATTDMKIRNVAADCGFSSPSRFYAAFERIVGQLPRDYRESVRPQ